MGGLTRFQGRVAQVIGLSIEVEGLRLAVGDVCTILPQMAGRQTMHGSQEDMAERRAGGISAEVVGFRDDRLIVMPFSDTQGVRPGSAVEPKLVAMPTAAEKSSNGAFRVAQATR